MMVFGVHFQVFGEKIDPFGEDGNLNFRRASIQLVDLEFFNNFLLLLLA